MDWLEPQWWRIAAFVLAGLAGWLFGRCTPHWAEDRWRDDAPHGAMDAYFDLPMDRSDTYGGCFGDFGAASGRFGSNVMSGIWLPSLLAALSCVVGWFGWGPVKDMPWWLLPQFWMLFGAAAAAYIVSRLTDKGPVGPLE